MICFELWFEQLCGGYWTAHFPQPRPTASGFWGFGVRRQTSTGFLSFSGLAAQENQHRKTWMARGWMSESLSFKQWWQNIRITEFTLGKVVRIKVSALENQVSEQSKFQNRQVFSKTSIVRNTEFSLWKNRVVKQDDHSSSVPSGAFAISISTWEGPSTIWFFIQGLCISIRSLVIFGQLIGRIATPTHRWSRSGVKAWCASATSLTAKTW